MNSLILFLHWLGAVGMGFYLLLPFLAMRITSLAAQEQAGYVSALRFSNRIGQYLVILQFLTGGYMVSKAAVSVPWMIASIVLVILIAAFAGMMSGPLKRMQANLRDGQPAGADAGKLRTFSLLLFISYIVVLILMYRPDLLG
jgi:heme A synthase